MNIKQIVYKNNKHSLSVSVPQEGQGLQQTADCRRLLHVRPLNAHRQRCQGPPGPRHPLQQRVRPLTCSAKL